MDEHIQQEIDKILNLFDLFFNLPTIKEKLKKERNQPSIIEIKKRICVYEKMDYRKEETVQK